MCISAIVTAVSAVAGVVGAVQQARAQKAQAEYSAAVSRNNAIIAQQNAADIVQRGEVAKDIQRRRVSQTIGAARAGLAGQGLLLDEGDTGTTAALLLDDLQVAGQMDIMTLKANVEREERRALIQGDQFTAEAGLFDLKASSINPAMAGLAAAGQFAPDLFSEFGGRGPVFPGGSGPTRPQPRPRDLL